MPVIDEAITKLKMHTEDDRNQTWNEHAIKMLNTIDADAKYKRRWILGWIERNWKNEIEIYEQNPSEILVANWRGSADIQSTWKFYLLEFEIRRIGIDRINAQLDMFMHEN